MKELYGKETKKAVENFDLNYGLTDLELIFAIVKIKKASAAAYQRIIPEKKEIYHAIETACDRILACEREYDNGAQAESILLDGTPLSKIFVTDALQGGAGTSTHMNVNEVLASMASRESGLEIHYLDDVNRGQSTNDVYSTALRMAAIKMLRRLSDECADLQTSLQQKENEFEFIDKLGRTELMDALPVTLGQEFGAFAQAIARDRWRLYKVEERLRQTNLGGTAVGTGLNADSRYIVLTLEYLREMTGIGLARAEYPMDMTQNQDVFVEVSGLLKALAANLMKIAGDLRLMNSGPHGGLGEISLAPRQAGSTIMPGKVNPVIAEMIRQVSLRVMANDFLISMAASTGEFELNASMPAIADALLESLRILTRGVRLFRERCIETLTANESRCRQLLDNSFAFATSYAGSLGYDKVAEIISKNNDSPARARQILDKLVSKH